MKRLWALCLALLLLPSCASMLEREYTVTSQHVENPPPQGDTAYRVETYPALRSALLSYVEEGMETGLLRFPTTYAGDLSVDLEKARRQLLEEEPLGCYGLEDVSFHTSRIIAYYETELTFTYRVEPKTLPSLPRAGSQSKLAGLLRQALEEGETSLVVYLSMYPEEDEGFFSGALELAYASRDLEEPEPSGGEGPPPEGAERAKLAGVELYPKTGVRRVAVLALEYPQPEPSPQAEQSQEVMEP